MRRLRIITLGLLLAGLVVHTVCVFFGAMNFERPLVWGHMQIHSLRSYIEEYKQLKGQYPHDLLKDLPATAQPWEMTLKSLGDPFGPPHALVRVVNFFDGKGGWFYDPVTGHIYPNYKRVRIWVSPFWFYTEDPSTWSQEPLK